MLCTVLMLYHALLPCTVLLLCTACRLSVLVAVVVFVVVTVILVWRPPRRDLAESKDGGGYSSSQPRAAGPQSMFWDPAGSAARRR
jgi:hypothetical protein